MKHAESMVREHFAGCSTLQKDFSTGGGFTLVEIAVVLVVIGLLVGGVLVARDLVHLAQVHRQVGQFAQYNTAVNVFRDRYRALPGDLPAADAASLGFTSRTGDEGRGDGNSLIEGCQNFTQAPGEPFTLGCEMLLFWSDLSFGGLIAGQFSVATDDYLNVASFDDALQFLPPTLLGHGTVLPMSCPYSGRWYAAQRFHAVQNGIGIAYDALWTAVDAHAIDAKMDDGLPLSGSVRASLYASPDQMCRLNPEPAPYCMAVDETYDISSPSGCALWARMN